MYKVKIDLTVAMKKISDMGIEGILKGPYWIKVTAKDPDEACHVAREKVCNTVHKKWGNLGDAGEEAVEIIRDDMKILKVDRI